MVSTAKEREELLKQRRSLYRKYQERIRDHLSDKEDRTAKGIAAFVKEEKAIRQEIERINKRLGIA